MNNLKDLSLEELEKKFKLDITKFKETLERQNNPEQFNGDLTTRKFFIFPVGKTILRILPPLRIGDNSFYKDFLSHRIGKSFFACPRRKKYTSLSDCPVCYITNQFYKIFYKNGSLQEHQVFRSVASAIKPRQKYLLNVIIKEVELEDKSKLEDYEKIYYTPKLLIIGEKLFQLIKEFVINNNIDVTNIRKGNDLIVIKKMTKAYERMFPTYEGTSFKIEPTPLASDTEKIKEILSNASNLEEEVLNLEKSKEQINILLHNYIKENLTPDQYNFFKKSFSNIINISNEFPDDESNNYEEKDDNNNGIEEENNLQVKNLNLDEFEKELLNDLNNEENKEKEEEIPF